LWAEWVGCGLSADVFWDLTMREVGAVMECKRRHVQNANLRAGLIAAILVNLHRKKGRRAVKPADFFATAPTRMSARSAEPFMDAWAASINRRVDLSTSAAVKRRT